MGLNQRKDGKKKMPEYIISPNWFYWISVIEDIKVIAFLACLVFVVLFIIMSIDLLFEPDEEARTIIAWKKKMKTFFVVILVLIACSIFIPSKDTMIEMCIAKIATVDNSKLAVETIKEATDYVFEKIGELNES